MATGIFTCAASSITLSPSTYYFIVLTAATPLAVGSYNWSIANTAGYDSSGGWILVDGYDSSSDGSSWSLRRSNPLQFAVYATAVPEPAAYALGVLGALLLGFHRRRNSSR